jgi:hypothetical protein
MKKGDLVAISAVVGVALMVFHESSGFTGTASGPEPDVLPKGHLTAP